MSSSTLRPTTNILSRSSLPRQVGARSVRLYATKPSSSPSNPTLHVPSDSRSDTLRSALYPADSYAPTSSSPTGNYHPDHLSRLQSVIPNVEVYETIERAWQLHQRSQRQSRTEQLNSKYKSMVQACNELESITNPSNGGIESRVGEEGKSKGGIYHRRIYEWATAEFKQSEKRGEQPKGKKTIEQRWKETRIEGLIPREQWVPVESKGKPWEYDWTRPGQ
ncbi:uncharacterized protein IL334_003564 [Kwoniella shivajii]|uniref:MRPL25 domain-containing protein n=1 Tax=Kwoniella shivajii TaxID=564305 RepID=A0ABZ1CZM1_9TREE|nr:hypothetical protein IL334_003564 [Kwoniella shivajii]